MAKRLQDMSLDELWQLFPIRLVPHDERWHAYYEEIEKTLRDTLASCPVVRISHIGSTAVPAIWAKNIVDVLVEIAPEGTLREAAALLEEKGCILMSTSAHRISLTLGYTETGYAAKVYHIHLRYAGDNDELYFRDYLCNHAEVANQYEQLKLRLWKQFEHHRDNYTNGKAAFVNTWTAEAKRVYPGRYASASNLSNCL